jgi:drug/metabolite transporter (DMT)-like permease
VERAIVIKIFFLLALTMSAFAANSVLNRLGVARYGMDPMDFAAIRVAAGAMMLWGLVALRATLRPKLWSRRRLGGAIALTGYMIGFSWAYLSLDAGIGALILFGVLQVVIFGWSVVEQQEIPPRRWFGAIIAFGGLCVLLWPTGAQALPLGGAIAMTIAGVAWAGYTLLGRGEPDALGSSAANFLLCLPLVLLAMPLSDTGQLTVAGAATAAIAGAITSGLGYALWYRILPQIPSTVAGIAQLSVPVLTVGAGGPLLAEPLTGRLVVAGLLVLGGIAIALPVRR